MDEQEIETWRRSQSRSQPPSSEHSEDSSDSKLERPLDFAEGNDLPATPAGDRRSTHANGTQSIQPSDTELAQANGTQDNQANDVPGHTTLPSEQDDTTAEKPSIDPKESLEPYEWDELEERFLKKMEECQIREKEIEEEFREWIQVFQAWASTTREHEEERAHKRLRTRMAWVQNSESTLEEKRRHYIKVVQAFESALALLTGA